MSETASISISSLLHRFAHWRLKYISDKTFLVLAATLTGVITSLLAVVLKVTVRFIESQVNQLTSRDTMDWLYLAMPLTGILLCSFYVHYFLKGKLGRGTGMVLYSISHRNANIERHKLYSQMISSVLTVGFGGSAGLEAPIVVTGSAYGSRIGNALRMTVHEKTLLIACGAAAGISAIFNCPIGGVIFAMEVILVRVTVPVFIPIIISSASASVISRLLYHGQPFFRITEDWTVGQIPALVVLGLGCGLLSVYCIRTFSRSEELLLRIRTKYLPSIACGIGLGLLIFLLPPLYGEGYHFIIEALNGNTRTLFEHSFVHGLTDYPAGLMILAAILMLSKVFATSLTIGGGGNGGMFGSSLYSGAFLGIFLTELLKVSGLGHYPQAQFVVAGMAGLLSGVFHAPLTAIFLLAEITGGYTLFVPLMITCALSFFVTRYFEPYSINTRKLIRKGELIFNNPDQELLSRLSIHQMIETDFASVNVNSKLRELIEKIPTSKRNLFPVTDNENQLHGIILLDDIRPYLFENDRYDKVLIRDIMIRPPALLDVRSTVNQAMEIFETTGAWNLPVMRNGKYAGFISKSSVLTRYRTQLKEDLSRDL